MKPTTHLWKTAVIVPLVFISLSGFSQPLKLLAAPDTNSVVKIEFVKADPEALVFDVDLSGLPETGCTLTVYGPSGEVLFKEWIKARSYRKHYRIERNNSDKISFEARGKNLRFKESFNLRYRLEEKIEVTKL